MIEYVDVQLGVWGKWVMRRASRGLGYPRVSPMFRDWRPPSRFESRPPFGVEDYVDDTDAALQRCPRELRELAFAVYVVRDTGDTAAALLGISRATLYRRLDTLHAAVLDQLHEIELDRLETANTIRRSQERPAAGCGV